MATSSADNNNNENQPPSPTRRRRSSIADFIPSRPVDTSSGSAFSNSTNGLTKPSPPNGTSMASAMAQQAQQQTRTRRLSITTLGLSGSPTRGSAFESLKERSQSTSAGQQSRPGDGRQRSQSYTSDESAIEEDGDSVGPMPNGEGYAANGTNGNASRPTSPSLQRRLSLGARAASGGSPGSGAGDMNGSLGGSKASPPLSARREGFNWQENLRNRAQRSSVSGGAPNGTAAASGTPFLGFATNGTSPNNNNHGRSKSIAVGMANAQPGSRNVSGSSSGPGNEAPPPTPATPGFGNAANGGGGGVGAKPAPAPAPAPQKAPDHFQERILKGDFYMD